MKAKGSSLRRTLTFWVGRNLLWSPLVFLGGLEGIDQWNCLRKGLLAFFFFFTDLVSTAEQSARKAYKDLHRLNGTFDKKELKSLTTAEQSARKADLVSTAEHLIKKKIE